MQFSFAIREETNLEVVLPVRWRNLYPGKPLDANASRETDQAVGTCHFVAVQENDIVIGCVTLTEESAHDRNFRMRWIGVDDNRRTHGVGSALAKACLNEAGRKGGGIWCNARLSARPLYLRLGFEELGVPFEIPEIGKHVVMRTP